MLDDALQVGIVAEGGPDEPNNQVLRRLQVLAQQASRRHPAPTRLQFIIQVPGSFYRPKVEGVRLGGFSRKENRLNVFIGIPERLREPLDRYLTEALKEGWRRAQTYLRRHSLDNATEPLSVAIDEVIDELSLK